MLDVPSEVKFLFQRDGIRKNIRIHFENGEFEDICNDKIVMNSVKFSESMCTRDKMKFGLCEASSFQCDVMDMPNMNGCQIFVQIEIDCSSLGEEWCNEYAQTSDDVPYPFYILPYGLMTIESSKKQTDMRKRRITAYSYQLENNISELTKVAIADKLDIEDVTKKPRVQFDVMCLAATNFPDKAMDDICDLYEVPDFEFYPIEEENPTVIKRSWGNIRKEYQVRHLPRTQEWEDDEYYYWLNYDYYDVELKANTGNEYHQILYIPTTPFLVNSDELYDFYLSMPLFINNKISFKDFDIAARKSWEFTDSGKIYYGKGNYVYMQNATRTTSSSRHIIIPCAINWGAQKKASLGQGSSSGKLDIRNRNDVKVYYCDVKYPSMYFNVIKSIDINKRPVIELENTLDMFESYLELQGLFGRFKRDGKFDLMTPKGMSALYPSQVLYPNDNLHPSGANIYSNSATYTSIWYDDELSKPYGRVSAVYKYIDAKTGKEAEEYAFYDLVRDYEVDPEKYLVYSLNDNFYIKNLTWELSDLLGYFRTIANAIKDIRYMPCQYKGVGLPFLEAGDTLEIQTSDGDMRTIILNRTITGEQLLTDTIKSN